ncbi:MAG: hypothetical protein HKO59_13370 [Phycisphaerales bacterium]|nr:flagellar export chaperone FlgN [Phycisphaerae bacterium]NNF44746.1 hypothetical protein [Phycisphaerales bacterium]NNM26952.1 hypothetical protein [Phycisphaerales bacterium]
MSNASSSESRWSRELLRVLGEQQAIVNELVTLGERQSGLIASADTEGLLALLAERQRLIERFTAAQQDMGVVTDGLAPNVAVADDERGRIQELIADISRQLAAVMTQDEADQAKLEKARVAAREAVNTVDTARLARQAYRQGQAVNNRFADRKG